MSNRDRRYTALQSLLELFTDAHHEIFSKTSNVKSRVASGVTTMHSCSRCRTLTPGFALYCRVNGSSGGHPWVEAAFVQNRIGFRAQLS